MEFIVEHDCCEWVATIDTYTGETEYTSDRDHARIFRGESWESVWRERDRHRVIHI